MKVLSNKEFADIITWTPSGKAFTIRQPKTFTAHILPDHFKSAKYSSFTRKLHRWGFMRHYRGDESGAFYHKDFQRERLDLVEQMSCLKSEPPKAPLAMKASQPKPSPPQPAETEMSGAATKPQTDTDVACPVAPKAASLVARLERPAAPQQPIPQPADVIARLQQQQQTLKTAEDFAAERLNAAIEAEVTRRLNERIQAAQKAALSRLVLVQQLGAGQPSRAAIPAAIPAPSIPQHRPISSATATSAARQQWSMAAGNLKTQLLLLQQKKQSLGASSDGSCLGLPAPGLPRMDTKGLDELPRTNIQGAKTA